MRQPVLSRRAFLSLGAGSLAFALLPSGHPRPVPRVALIGAGQQGMCLLRALQSLPVRVTGVADVRAEALAQAAALVPGAFLTQNARRLLDSSAVEAVLIATPDFSHAELAQAALQAGKGVYLEPPLTPTLESLRVLQHTAHVAKCSLHSGDFLGRHPLHTLAAEIVRAGILGTLERIQITVHTSDAAQPPAYRQHASSYGTAFTQFAERIGRVQQICHVSRPVRITAHGGTFVAAGQRATPDTLFAMLQFAEGFTVNYAALVGDPEQDVFTLHGTHGMLDLQRGRLEVDQIDPRTLAHMEAQFAHALHACPDLLAEHLAAWLSGLAWPDPADGDCDAAVVEVTEWAYGAFLKVVNKRE